MRKAFFASLLMLFVCGMQAQEQIRVWKEGNSKRFTTSEVSFSEDGSTFSVVDSTYDCAQIDSITVVHTITVTFAGDTAYVDYGHATNVTDTIQGAHVKLNSTNTKSELEFVLQGESTHGSFTYDGPLKCKFYLNGLNLKSDQGAAIDIKCGKRIDFILNPGTDNFLADAANGDQKAALHCKGHLEISGSGNLTITGNAKHGIDTKEYLEIKKSTGNITIKKAMGDGMHIGQYFLMNGGNVSITGQKGDGIQIETMTIITESNDTIPNPDKEFNGQMFYNGGKLYIKAYEDCTKGIKVPGDMTVTGDTLRVEAVGDGSKGISVSGNVLINKDTSYPLVQVRCLGDTWEDEEEKEDDVYCCGIKIKGDFIVDHGHVQVTKTNRYQYPIRLSKNSVYVHENDDAIVEGSVSRTSK